MDETTGLEQESNGDSTAIFNDEGGSIPIVAMEDVWAASEGYTPLHDFLTNNHNDTTEGAFFCDGTNGGTIYTSFPGAFYASIGIDDDNENVEIVESEGYHDYSYLHDHDDEDEDLDVTTATSSTSYFDSIQDYRSVADNALLMLDRDYQNIVSLPQMTTSLPPIENKSFSTLLDSTDINDNTHVSFVAEIDDSKDLEVNNEVFQQPIKATLTIDTDAVRRAVYTIQLKNPNLQHNLRIWESKQSQQLQAIKRLESPRNHNTRNTKDISPRLHPIIPETPLGAFRKVSNKAARATANLSRSACIAEALRRFNILQYHVDREQTVNIHILGCDHVECGYHSSENGQQFDEERIRTLFGPIVRWMGAYAEAPSHINIELIGPNIPNTYTFVTIDLMPRNRSSLKECLQSANLRCHSGTYESILETSSSNLPSPDLVIAFNAGIWGYHDWGSTIQFIIQRQSPLIPFVVTSYTIEEAEDDYDVIDNIVKSQPVEHKKVMCEWDVEHNPFSCREERHTTSSNSQPKRSTNYENAAWQAWRL